MTKRFPYKPEEDGVTHINVYSKGQTTLGRFLSNFAYTPFTHPEDGFFCSVEGYWYWLGCKDDRLRELAGYEAKRMGRIYGAPDWIDDDVFKRKIKLALRSKIKEYIEESYQLSCSTPPLTHYYVTKSSIIPVPQSDWILEELENIRAELKSRVL